MDSAEKLVQEYVTVLNEHDVLLGRGAPILNSAGNVRFRNLIKENRPAYTATGRHAVKDEIAKNILETITEKGGRFLRKIESDEDRAKYGVLSSVLHAWVAIDRTAQLQKVKQALREQLTSRSTSRRKQRAKNRTESQYSSEAQPSESSDDQGTFAAAGLPAASSQYLSHRTSLDDVAREYQRNISHQAPISDQTLLMHSQLALDRLRADRFHPALDPRLVLPQRPPSSLADLYGYGTSSSSPLLNPYHHRSSDRDVTQMLDQYVLDLQLRGEMLARELAIARAARQRAALLGGDAGLRQVSATETKLPSSSSSSDDEDGPDRQRPDRSDNASKPRAK